jgi:hypothetical protein
MAFSIGLGTGLLGHRGALAVFSGGLIGSWFVGSALDEKRFCLAQLMLFFLILSIEIGILVGLAQSERKETAAYLFYSALMFPLCAGWIGMFFISRAEKKKNPSGEAQKDVDA